MTEREEIDMLRRTVADLIERVRVLEMRSGIDHTLRPTDIGITPMRGPVYTTAPDASRGPKPAQWIATSTGGITIPSFD